MFLRTFKDLFLSTPGAPGICICGYFCTSLRDHPLHCQGHSCTEGSEKVGMYPTRLGLVETGVGYTETVHKVRRRKEKFCTAIRKYNDLFMQSGYQAAAVDTWDGLHFLPLIMTIFLSHHENSFVNQLDSGVFGFDRCKGMTLFDDQTDVKSVASTDPYQAYMIAPIVKGGFRYVGVGLVFKPATIGAGHITKCKMFLNSFFSLCGDLPDMAPREVYLLRKCRGVGPLSQPLQNWTCLDLLTPNLGIQDPQVNPGMPVYHSSSLTFRLMTASEHYLVRTWEEAHIFIPLEFNKRDDTKFHWHRTSMLWHNGMCGWVQLVSEHVLAHHSEIFESLGNTTIAAALNTFIETMAPPSFKSLSRISNTTSIAHAGNPTNTHWGLGSTWSE